MLLDALKSLLLESGFRGENVCVLSASKEHTFREHKLPSMNRLNLIGLLLKIRKGDILISGPGGLFQDTTGPWSPLFYSSHIFLAHARKAKVFLYGQSLGPIARKANLALLKLVVSKASLVALRDKNMSYIVPNNKLFFTPDPAFALDFAVNEPIRREGVCFVFRKWYWDLEKIIQAILKLNTSLSIISFQPDLEREEGKRLSKKFGVPFYELVDWREALKLISSFEILFGMRLHSLVVSALASTPFVGISYDPKVKNLCELLKMPYISDERELALLDRYVGTLMVKWDRERERLKEKVQILRNEVKNVFKECMDILMGGNDAKWW